MEATKRRKKRKDPDARHPHLDHMWEKHRRLIHWWATKIGRILSCKPSEYLGILYIRLNRVLWHWEPKLGYKFSTYYSSHILAYVLASIKNDSEHQRTEYYKYRVKQDKNNRFNYIHVPDAINTNKFRKVPYKDHKDHQSWCMDLIEDLGGPQNTWEIMKTTLSDREAAILYRHVAEEVTFADIADSLKISKQRVHQILLSATEKMTERLCNNREFRRAALYYMKEVVVPGMDKPNPQGDDHEALQVFHQEPTGQSEQAGQEEEL